MTEEIRFDHQIILQWVEERSRVLDLGCGDGTLLKLLIEHKSCHGTGVEIDEKAIYTCMEKGLTVSHVDIDTGLADYSNKDRKSTRLNSSHSSISYAVFCLKKK